jgi:hypothetical protein
MSVYWYKFNEETLKIKQEMQVSTTNNNFFCLGVIAYDGAEYWSNVHVFDLSGHS